jgi:hypothetical protein
VQGDKWDGESLQMRMTRYAANPFVTPAQIFNGQFITADPYLGHCHLRTDEKMLMLAGEYDTHMNRLAGSWWRYATEEIFGNLNGTTRIGKTSESTAARGGSNPDGAPSQNDQGSLKREIYHLFTDTATTVYIDVDPASYRLPNPADYTEADLMRMFNGSKKGSGNLTYRTVLSRPEHFNIDYNNNRLQLYRAAETGTEYFFMWEII